MLIVKEIHFFDLMKSQLYSLHTDSHLKKKRSYISFSSILSFNYSLFTNRVILCRYYDNDVAIKHAVSSKQNALFFLFYIQDIQAQLCIITAIGMNVITFSYDYTFNIMWTGKIHLRYLTSSWFANGKVNLQFKTKQMFISIFISKQVLRWL